jgi:hypothetical protein
MFDCKPTTATIGRNSFRNLKTYVNDFADVMSTLYNFYFSYEKMDRFTSAVLEFFPGQNALRYGVVGTGIGITNIK